MPELKPKYNWKDRERIFSDIERYHKDYKYVKMSTIEYAVKKVERATSGGVLENRELLWAKLSMLNNMLRSNQMFAKASQWGNDE